MNRFDYLKAASVADAIRHGSAADAAFLAGGSNLIDLMKENAAQPTRIIDINRLPLNSIEALSDGGLRLGALATNADTARDPQIVENYPLLASAILAGASPQLRNAATNGGNLNQRTRCYYFYDPAALCNKRIPGSGCGAIGGITRIHAILGASEQCIATHPSDMCVALSALDAKINVTGPDGDRVIDMADYHRLPGEQPWLDNTLNNGELVTSIDLPNERFSTHYTYLKLRDRLSYAFALVSVAVAMRLEAGKIADVRMALGGVAHKPWRRLDVEHTLKGVVPSRGVFAEAAAALLAGATGYGANGFKIPLAHKAVIRALEQASAATPQSQTDKRVA